MTTFRQKTDQKDPWVNRIIVGALATTLCACVGGAIGLQINNQPIPGLLTGLAFGSLSTLAKLAQSPSAETEASSQKPQEQLDSGI
jgi:hypothetical protein